MKSAQIVESFRIAGRGTVIVIDNTTDLPVGRCLQATIQLSDGTSKDYQAWKEWLHRRAEAPLEDEAFLIVDATVSEVPIGALISLEVGDN